VVKRAALKDRQRALFQGSAGKAIPAGEEGQEGARQDASQVANRRKDRVHPITAALVKHHSLIVTEDLSIKTMTASAKGTVETPGQNVKAKAGLNRAILDAPPGGLVNNLRVKAEEAGRCQVLLLDPRKHRSSQTCAPCGAIRNKGLDECDHHCGCGFSATRDQNAALSMLADGLRLLGRQPARAARLETPARAA
jgi:putative transposase